MLDAMLPATITRDHAQKVVSTYMKLAILCREDEFVYFITYLPCNTVSVGLLHIFNVDL